MMVMILDDKSLAMLSHDDDSGDDDGGDDDNDEDDHGEDDHGDATHAGSSPQTGPEDLISGYCSHLPEDDKSMRMRMTSTK